MVVKKAEQLRTAWSNRIGLGKPARLWGLVTVVTYKHSRKCAVCHRCPPFFVAYYLKVPSVYSFVSEQSRGSPQGLLCNLYPIYPTTLTAL